MSDVTFDIKTNQMKVHHKNIEHWKVTLVDTGQNTMTGGRLLQIKEYLDEETFCFTYGDGLSNLDIQKSILFHKSSRSKATMTAVKPPGRYGSVSINSNYEVTNFQEKPRGDGGWINGGFFILEPSVLSYIKSSQTMWEEEPLKNLSKNGELSAYKHEGFWHPMDTLRDKNYLNKLWESNKAPWKVWND